MESPNAKRYSIQPTAGGLRVAIQADAERQPRILASLEECKTGQCSCPTPEYDKIANIDISVRDDSVEINLEARPGARIEPSRIEGCVEHTIKEGRPSTPSAELRRA